MVNAQKVSSSVESHGMSEGQVLLIIWIGLFLLLAIADTGKQDE